MEGNNIRNSLTFYHCAKEWSKNVSLSYHEILYFVSAVFFLPYNINIFQHFYFKKSSFINLLRSERN
jgi:hypothetical protein